ncbi:MAG: aminotransferase class V-fold PLP-dependent enzyme, partial [Gammaproteobacteria bacterium]
MKKPVYLDYAATTPVDPRVAEKMAACLTTSGLFANPASTSHLPGREARGLVELARAEVADLVGADLLEIVFTSGATESDNLAIKGAAHFNADRGKHVVTCRTEHKAVLDTCKQLEQEGFDVTYLVPDCSGILEREQIADALRSDTVLVSFMHVNNETGVVHDISAIGALCRERGVLFHVDAAQSTGKLPIDLSTVPVDLMSFSAHKIYGPKGIGALYVRREPRAFIEPQMHGGGHERGLRSGTLATHQIVGMGDAFRIAGESMAEDSARIRKLRDRLWEGISELPGVYQNGCAERRVCGVL